MSNNDAERKPETSRACRDEVKLNNGVKYYFYSGSVDCIPSYPGERRFAVYDFNDEST